MKIFFSYPHDENAALVERIKSDLEIRGHEVWFDKAEIKSGDDWRDAITRGILDSQQVVAFLSKHAVRDPGVCLNEIAIALADKGEAMVTVLVEPESEVSAPVSITHIQWLKMEEWQSQAHDDGWYRTRLDRLIDAIENPTHAGRNEELETLKLALDPMSFYAEIAPHIPGFTGRRWIIDRYTTWLAHEPDSRVLRIEGGPGLGKTAVASYLAHSTKSSVLAVHLCQYNKGESRNPLRLVRTLAYQLATRLPDYRARLIKSVAIQRPETIQGKDPASLWSELVSAPLSGVGKGTIDRQRMAIIIDGLDEATVEGKNPIVELLATEINQLPKWIGVVLTGRPDPELAQRLARYRPLVLRDDDPQNIADLKAYADEWLAREVTSGKLTSNQAHAASEALLAKCQGAFLYLSQARIAVAENMFDLTQPTLFPSGLTEIYQRFFERRFPDVGNDVGRYKAKVRPLLELVLASPEPLPVSIAKEILKWGPYAGPEVINSLGSLLKRAKGGLVSGDEETLAPFHNSVREWLQDADSAGDFHVNAEAAAYPLTEMVWHRHLEREEKDAYSWQVLPDLLPMLSETQHQQLFGPPTRETSDFLYRLALSLGPKLRFTEAAATWKVLVPFSERLSCSYPENQLFAFFVSSHYAQMSYSQKILGNSEAALALSRRSLEIKERLYRKAPDTSAEESLRLAYTTAGDMERELGNNQAAMALYQQSLESSERLYRSAPEDARFTRGLCMTYDRLGDIQLALAYSQTTLSLPQLGPENPERVTSKALVSADFAVDPRAGFDKMSDRQPALGNIQAAMALYQQSLEMRERLVSALESTKFTDGLSEGYRKLGDVHQALGNNQAALAFYQQSNSILERQFRDAPESALLAIALSISYNKLGKMQQALGNNQTAMALFQQGFELRDRLFRSDPENAKFANYLIRSYMNLGEVQQALGKVEAALVACQKGLEIAERLSNRAPENAEFARDLWVSYWKCATVSEGEVQMQWWDKVHSALIAMQERGILAKGDEQYIAVVKAQLGLD